MSAFGIADPGGDFCVDIPAARHSAGSVFWNMTARGTETLRLLGEASEYIPFLIYGAALGAL